jgi:hypothetical protein
MVELADTQVLEACAERREGSSPSPRTIQEVMDILPDRAVLAVHETMMKAADSTW